ncbi:uncharacterized protein MYCFIDRAFT_202013 [Pseudocercospora fijiensis CIRAD86]|uniref:BZIP domain-containing protein n=1 Tax=Pseudocercospora fijiensis (strain CIRAD86) TaxID=383855 RepID=N1QD24_PSEFD|nr:uncharacterized protein MYCFIDRAFT_202013 [Pseudocercospora fijiensis CIRAD86]EME89638.1 hypothetical protein MYCFIDRAFT_202013 [Pseudocercospora fijiensis CIRAD86]
MTNNLNIYHKWCSGQDTLPEHPPPELQELPTNSHPYWLIRCPTIEFEPDFNSSNVCSPDMSYQQLSFDSQFCNAEDYLDFQRIGTPQPTFKDDDLDAASQVSIETSERGSNKHVRRREQNRASQRAYRDRQRGKIAELQANIVALKAQNEKLQARNSMLEATSQRQIPDSKK